MARPDALLVAVEYRTSQILWKTPNPRGWKMTHSSIMKTEFAGREIYVYCGTGGTAGIAAYILFLVGTVLVLANLQKNLRASTGTLRWQIKGRRSSGWALPTLPSSRAASMKPQVLITMSSAASGSSTSKEAWPA